jgi:hypothetical protein
MMEDRREISPEAGESRRSAVRKMAYAAPFVLSLAASPEFASAGSGSRPCHNGSSSDRSTPQRSYKTNTR